MQDFTPARGMAGIYAIVHRATGLPYIGSSRNIHGRWGYHRSTLRRGAHTNERLQAAWDEYGEDAFVFLVVEDVPDPGQMQAREQVWLDQVEPHLPGRGFNRRATSNGTGHVWTDEQRARVSAGLRGYTKTPEHRAALSLAQRRIPERRREIGIAGGRAGRGKPKSAAHRAAIGAAQTGAANHQSKLTPEQVRAIRARLAETTPCYGSKTALAREFGISPTTIRKIELGTAWAWLDRAPQE